MASGQNITETRTDEYPVFIGSETLGFACSNMPPNIRIYVYVNDINITPFCAPTTARAQMGDPILTDQLGIASGLMYIPSIEGKYKFAAGEIRLTFGDSPDGVNNCKFISETTIFNHGLNLVDTEQGGTISLRSTEKIRTYNEGNLSDEGATTLKRLDPLSQTFIVNESKYPLGVVVTGVALFVYEKDPDFPLSVELRPMAGETPSTTEYISGSFSVLSPDVIEVYDQKAQQAKATNFTFQHPIYLKPGEYALCITTKSNKYTLLSASQGGGRTVKQPFTGKLFKPQNSGEWVGSTNEDITFYLRKAKFETGTVSFTMQTAKLTGLEYNKLRLLTTAVNYGDTAYATYRIRTTNAGTNTRNDFQDILPNQEPTLDGRQVADSAGDISVEISLTTKDPDISPILDKQLIKAQIFRNQVRPYSEEVSRSELNAYHGAGISRYLSRIVPLQEGFDSTGISVQLEVNRKTGTDIEVFARVLSRKDKTLPNGIYDRPFVKLPLVEPSAKTFAGTDDDEFNTEVYRLLSPEFEYVNNISASETTPLSSAAFDTFAYYQIKIVFYASNPVFVPKIRNLVATALL